VRTLIGVGAYEGCAGDWNLQSEIIAIGAAWVLCHRCDGLADRLAIECPGTERILRGDEGNDGDQYDEGSPALPLNDRAHEAAERFDRRFIAPRWVHGRYHGVQGPCEHLANSRPAGIQFRFLMEAFLGAIVHAKYRQPNGQPAIYVGLNAPTGNVDAGHLAMYEREARAFFEEVDRVGYHGYLRPWARSVADEIDGDYLYRPVRQWAAMQRRLGMPIKPLMLTEAGTYYHPAQSGISQEDEARLVVAISARLAYECAVAGVPYVGAAGFGFGTVGSMSDWNQRGCGPIYAEACKMPKLGQGMRDAIAQGLLGAVSEDEIYHAAGLEDETSLAIGPDGYAVWRRETNATVVVRNDNAIFTNRGNAGTGRFVRVD
jgi:hypothetical protein